MVYTYGIPKRAIGACEKASENKYGPQVNWGSGLIAAAVHYQVKSRR